MNHKEQVFLFVCCVVSCMIVALHAEQYISLRKKLHEFVDTASFLKCMLGTLAMAWVIIAMYVYIQ